MVTSERDCVVAKFVGFGGSFCCCGRLDRTTGSSFTLTESLFLPWSLWFHFLCFDKLQVVLNWVMNFSRPFKDQPPAFDSLTSCGREMWLETFTYHLCTSRLGAWNVQATALQSDLDFIIAWDGIRKIAGGDAPSLAVLQDRPSCVWRRPWHHVLEEQFISGSD